MRDSCYADERGGGTCTRFEVHAAAASRLASAVTQCSLEGTCCLHLRVKTERFLRNVSKLLGVTSQKSAILGRMWVQSYPDPTF
jgi:hypothetical protein